jgi:hypothetical protein
MEHEIKTKLHTLFDTIINLSNQYQIKDIYTPVTIEKLTHDYELEDKIKEYVKEFGVLINNAKKENVDINPEYIKTYNILIK